MKVQTTHGYYLYYIHKTSMHLNRFKNLQGVIGNTKNSDIVSAAYWCYDYLWYSKLSQCSIRAHLMLLKLNERLLFDNI